MLSEHRDTITETLIEVAEIELARLDDLLGAVWEKAKAGSLESIDRALKIMDRRARMLGLDKEIAPDWRVEIVHLLRAGQVTMEDVRKELGDELAATIIEFASQDSNVGRTPKGAIEIELSASSA